MNRKRRKKDHQGGERKNFKERVLRFKKSSVNAYGGAGIDPTQCCRAKEHNKDLREICVFADKHQGANCG